MRLHTRTILRDRERAFIGSQSLRDIELEKRPRNRRYPAGPKSGASTANNLRRGLELSEGLWVGGRHGARGACYPDRQESRKGDRAGTAAGVACPGSCGERVRPDIELNPKQVEESVKHAVKEAVKEAVKDVVERVAMGDKG